MDALFFVALCALAAPLLFLPARPELRIRRRQLTLPSLTIVRALKAGRS